MQYKMMLLKRVNTIDSDKQNFEKKDVDKKDTRY